MGRQGARESVGNRQIVGRTQASVGKTQGGWGGLPPHLMGRQDAGGRALHAPIYLAARRANGAAPPLARGRARGPVRSTIFYRLVKLRRRACLRSRRCLPASPCLCVCACVRTYPAWHPAQHPAPGPRGSRQRAIDVRAARPRKRPAACSPDPRPPPAGGPPPPSRADPTRRARRGPPWRRPVTGRGGAL
jgi:hypothetical protein